MESLTYRNERETALVKTISEKEASAEAAVWYQNERIRKLVNDLGMPLSEGIRLYTGINCRTPSNADHLADFLKSLLFLKSEVEKDADLRAAYSELSTEDRATPLEVVIEASTIIYIAIVTGAATEIGASLAKFLLGKTSTKKGRRALMEMLLSSPIPSLLSCESNGLTAVEIAARTKLSPEEVTCFLDKYASRGWLERQRTSAEDIWILQRDNINSFFGL